MHLAGQDCLNWAQIIADIRSGKTIAGADVDNTLCPSRQPISQEMAKVLAEFLLEHPFFVISAQSISDFERQVATPIANVNKDALANMYPFLEQGAQHYRYDTSKCAFRLVYSLNMDRKDKDEAIAIINQAVKDSGYEYENPFGETLQVKESSITWSACGRKAPADIKKAWDPDESKRAKIIELCRQYDVEDKFSFKVGGTNSIDISYKGMDKSYAVRQIHDRYEVPYENIAYLGDQLKNSDGNDWPVRQMGVDTIQVDDPNATYYVLKTIANGLPA